MENPYESPRTQQHARVTLRSLWRQRLTCSHCGESGVTVGGVTLAHPLFRVRCGRCSKQSRVKYSATAVKREVTMIIVVTVLGTVVFSSLFLLDPFDGVHDFLENWLPGFSGADFTVLGIDGQKFLVATVLGLISITPFLILLVIATRQCLEHAAMHSQLIPVEPQLPVNGGK